MKSFSLSKHICIGLNDSNVAWGSNGGSCEDGVGGTLKVFDELQLGAFRQRVISAFANLG